MRRIAYIIFVVDRCNGLWPLVVVGPGVDVTVILGLPLPPLKTLGRDPGVP